ncbi:TetR/AcrR family transcriptional regulator [Aquipseudomonas alcaligenes]|uniref:Transcriptional regulator, TetR family n=1 Tax=Aquipseudomonas alcaligenes TaxID=43263 RepID=A0A1N6QKD9_AQUAC|nr:TetR family transcriptional regulator [Pseudomonas alcaligenes]SIQ17038.1 transcriptional regulator, TetR family [Pseudomonas alcaligenes]
MNLSSAVECPVRLAGELAESVQYRGRKASRQGSEQRRLSILEAALRIIVREGLRGVRHRAVAAEAGVPLSATTYYFNDIQDLIADSFALFVKRSSASLAALWAGMEDDFRRIAAAIEQDPRARRELVTHFIDLAVAHVLAKMRAHDDELLVELAFRQEALTNPQLRPLFLAHQQLRFRFAERAVRAMGSKAPVEDAQVLTTLVLRMEYHAIVDGVEDFDQEGQRAVLRRFLDLVIGA